MIQPCLVRRYPRASTRATLASQIDKTASEEMQAYQAWYLRNTYRTEARNSMQDIALAESYNKTDPNMTWAQTVSKYAERGFTGDALWKEIAAASQRSRTSVNTALGF